jgi:hypothetical protein
MPFYNYYDDFLKHLKITVPLPEGVDVLYPYENPDTVALVKQFYHLYYNDDHPRIMLIGINPGRFGAGVTGIPFTDPIRLTSACGIENTLPQKPELSSKFIYEMIQKFGGVRSFYKKYLISAVSPLGFVSDGKNLNYYDIRALQTNLEPFIVYCMNQQLKMGAQSDVAYSLGQGANFKYLVALNKKWNFFGEIKPLPHPRWVMQYRLRKKEFFIEQYLEALM